MVASLSKFRKGDRVRVDARGEFYAYVDGWRGRVAVVGPADPNACHSQVPGGHCLVECDTGNESPLQIIVPHDELAFDL